MPSRCQAQSKSGQPCRAAPLHGGDLCFFHDPGHAEAAAEARRLGGQRQRQEAVVASTFDIDVIDVSDVEGLRRVFEITLLDTLALPSNVHRSRTLAYLIWVGTRLYEVAALGARVALLEEALHLRDNGSEDRRAKS